MDNEKNTDIRALVVDDNQINILMLVNMIELFGIHADHAADGNEAIQLCETMTYDIIFVDHMMPGMDGIKTTNTIRNISAGNNRTIIIALTSDVTDELKASYRIAGADYVYAKPLELTDLTKLLKRFHLKVQINSSRKIQGKTDTDDEKIKSTKTIIKSMKGIQYPAILIDNIKDTSQLKDVLEVSLRDLASCISIIIAGYENNSLNHLLIGTHKLKSVFGSIGATTLLVETRSFETLLMSGKELKINREYETLIYKLDCFKNKLIDKIDKCNILIGQEKFKLDYAPMTDEEYEQCLLNTIYYIRRFEYDSITRDLQSLILFGVRECSQEFEAALKEIKEFQYEKALIRIINIKNKTGNLPIPDEIKFIKLDNFWD